MICYEPFIKTVSRRGYRFIAPVTTTPEVLSGGGQVEPAFRAAPAGHPWVGLAEALARLQGYLERARGGVRQLVRHAEEPVEAAAYARNRRRGATQRAGGFGKQRGCRGWGQAKVGEHPMSRVGP